MTRKTAATTAAAAVLLLGLAGPGATSTATGQPVAQEPGRNPVGSTVRVSGSVVSTDDTNLHFRMRGGLIGNWTMAPSETLYGPSYFFYGSGRETFTGCLNLNRNTRCEPSEPAGEFLTAYLYWASVDPSGRLIRGQCVYPLTGGRGRFAGVRGVLTMNDRRVGNEIRSTYEATVVLDAIPGEVPPLTEHAKTARSDKMNGSNGGRRSC